MYVGNKTGKFQITKHSREPIFSCFVFRFEVVQIYCTKRRNHTWHGTSSVPFVVQIARCSVYWYYSRFLKETEITRSQNSTLLTYIETTTSNLLNIERSWDLLMVDNREIYNRGRVKGKGTSKIIYTQPRRNIEIQRIG